jgi:diguanylate cyclase (GGDEF)-like protein
MFSFKQLIEVLSCLPDPTFILTESGLYSDVFGGTDKRYYHDARKLIGLSVKDVLVEERAIWFINKINQAIKSKQLLIAEYSLSGDDVKGLKSDGPNDVIYFEARVQVLNFKIKGESAVLWQATNISKRYLLEQKLRTISETDPLTGCWNRRYFYQAIEAEKKRASRNSSQISLMIIDIDHFKMINDQWGHQAGDQILSEIVLRINNHLRNSDSLIRWGGEEFIVLMPDTCEDEAYSVAEKLRKQIQNNCFSDDIQVTVSIGYAQWDFDNEYCKEVVAAIDTALYMAKNDGRNCVKGRNGK